MPKNYNCSYALFYSFLQKAERLSSKKHQLSSTPKNKQALRLFTHTLKRQLMILNLKLLSLTIFITLTSALSNFSYAHCHLEDWQILQELYVSTDGANWTNNSGWYQVDPFMNPSGPAFDCDLSTMYGIVLDADERVVGINLSNNNLTGSIPSEIGDLVNLTSLTLNGNNLDGSIPASFANLTNLTQFDISNNAMTGCYATNLTASNAAGNTLQPGGTTYVRPTSSTLVVTDFDPLMDKIDVGPESIHTQIVIDGPDGLMFQNMFNQNTALILEGVSLKDLSLIHI